MNATIRTAIVNALASSTTPTPLDDLMSDLKLAATDLAELHKDGMVHVAWTAEGNVVSLTAKGLATIPAGASLTPAQHAVLMAVNDAYSGQLPIATLYAIESHKVNPAVVLEMVSRGWLAVEYVEADGETQAGISVSLSGKTGKDGTFQPSKAALAALEYPVRAAAVKVAGAPRGTNGTVEHLPIPETFTKTFKERSFTCHGNGDGKTITVDELGKSFPSPTAAAKAIQTAVNGKAGEVNGWDWFGLTK